MCSAPSSISGRFRTGDWRNTLSVDVADYLGKAGREGRLADWLFLLRVDALTDFLRNGQRPWRDEVEWSYERHSARSLPPSHPTSARESTGASCAGPHRGTTRQQGQARSSRAACLEP